MKTNKALFKRIMTSLLTLALLLHSVDFAPAIAAEAAEDEAALSTMEQPDEEESAYPGEETESLSPVEEYSPEPVEEEYVPEPVGGGICA
ncbi:MAG: hypothetical protein IKE58_09120 [Blautia sp.]|nr:hypothetical protein [Blautia sp.]